MNKLVKITISLLVSSTFVFQMTNFVYAKDSDDRVTNEKKIGSNYSKVLVPTVDKIKLSGITNNLLDKRLKCFLDKKVDINSFKKLYGKENIQKIGNINVAKLADNLSVHSNSMENLQSEFGKRLRNSKDVIGREYYKNETKTKLNNVVFIDSNIYEVDVTEETKLFYRTPSGTENLEIYMDKHIFKIALNNNGNYTVIDEAMPNSLLEVSTHKNIFKGDAPTDSKKTTSNVQKRNYTTLATTQAYDRNGAVSYANSYWITGTNSSNYFVLDSDCTNYVSQCIKAGFLGVQDTSGTYQWFYNYGSWVGHGYSASWSAAQNNHDYWYYGQRNTTQALEVFSTPPSRYSVVNQNFYNTSNIGDPVYYHTDPKATVYYNHAAFIVGYEYIYSGLSRPVVNSHTSDRYHVDYTLYPYLDYQSMINIGYAPSVTVVHIPDWSAYD